MGGCARRPGPPVAPVEIGPGRVVFESADAAEVEARLSGLYTAVRLGTTGSALPTRVVRQRVGEVTFSALRFGADFAYDAEPDGCWKLLAVRQGSVRIDYADGGRGVVTTGQVAALEAPERRNAGEVRGAGCHLVTLAPAALARVSDRDPGGTPPRLGGRLPIDSAAGARLGSVLEHFGAHSAAIAASPLLAGTAVDYLAAVALDTFAAAVPPPPADRADAHPETVRRAIAYMESHAREDISLADIAVACCVTIRSVQLAFRRHLQTTPVHHLRRIRLDGAHADLVAADPDTGQTVSGIAFVWGFSNPGRFAAAYRHAYGCSPSETLHR